MLKNAKWITAPCVVGDAAPCFIRNFACDGAVSRATLYITARGVYEAYLNEKRIGRFVLAPGWTAYNERLQYQVYDITALLAEKNSLNVTVGRGWYASPIPGETVVPPEMRDQTNLNAGNPANRLALLAALHISYTDGTEETVFTDDNWQYGESAIRFSEIYDGERYDATFQTPIYHSAQIIALSYDNLIEQEGEEIREQERIYAKKIFVTPQGDTIVDFGQEVTGYVEFTVEANAGDMVRFSHSEVLDKNGNFYNENYRTAKALVEYTCMQGCNTYHPHLTFFGFRQIRLERWPQPLEQVKPEQFCAIAVYSNIRQTGHLVSSNAVLNQFFSNVFWGQRDNFLDIPTDCPQRDERLGWTGDAQMFCKAASYNFDVLRFFRKWLHDLAVEQQKCGGAVPEIIPNVFPQCRSSAAWADVATVIPWQMYMTYGDHSVLNDQFESMKQWVDTIGKNTKKQDLWCGCWHFGDWLGLDAEPGSYVGASRCDLLASAFYARSTMLLVQAGQILGKDISGYEALYERIVKAFRKEWPEYLTQTECAVAVHFGVAEDTQKTVDTLAALIRKAGRMETGFVGTPYLLHALSDNGYADMAYELLLREEYPSWLSSVKKGATTVWEHWDGIRENGDFWSSDMNSFNHYAYGAVIDWVYEKAAGICPAEPGFSRVKIQPIPTERLDWLEASIETVHGNVYSKWSYFEDKIRYDITLPVTGDVIIDGVKRTLPAGSYILWGNA